MFQFNCGHIVTYSNDTSSGPSSIAGNNRLTFTSRIPIEVAKSFVLDSTVYRRAGSVRILDNYINCIAIKLLRLGLRIYIHVYLINSMALDDI